MKKTYINPTMTIVKIQFLSLYKTFHEMETIKLLNHLQ
jgi:hypothetical protein